MTTATWYADVDIVTPRPLTEDDIDDALDQLLDQGGALSVSPDGSTVGASITVDAPSAIEASTVAVATIARALRVPSEGIIRIDVRTEDVAEAELREPTIPDLVGYAEIAAMAGVSRQRAREFAAKADFPVAVVDTASGPLRLRASVQSWIAHRNTKPGRPRAHATA